MVQANGKSPQLFVPVAYHRITCVHDSSHRLQYVVLNNAPEVSREFNEQDHDAFSVGSCRNISSVLLIMHTINIPACQKLSVWAARSDPRVNYN